MRDFSNFKQPNSEVKGDGMELIKNLAKKYEGASEGEIISAIMKEAEKGRKNGTLTDADIDNFYAMLSPMLNASQRKKLDEVVKKLKRS